MRTEFLYEKTAFGQLLYDLIFTKLSEKYLARKHRLPIAKVRMYRATARAAFKGAKGAKPKKARTHNAMSETRG